MKKLLFLFILFISSVLNLSAQPEYYKFLLQDFEAGEVVYRNNTKDKASFNYETISEKMLFLLSDSTILELAEPEKVLLVYIGDRVFEHMGKGIFYERIKINEQNLYIRWKSSVVSKGQEVGYGMISGSGAVDNIDQASVRGSFSQMKTTEVFRTTQRNRYYLEIQNKLKQFKSFKDLAKLFKKEQTLITEYVRNENLDFNDPTDILKAVTYSSELTKQ